MKPLRFLPLKPDIVCREFVRLLVNVPFERRGPFRWVSWCEIGLERPDLTMPLDFWDERYLVPAISRIVAIHAAEFSINCMNGWGAEPAATSEWLAFKAELRTRYLCGPDQEEWQFRVFYNPTPLTAGVPLYHWLGEMAEAA